MERKRVELSLVIVLIAWILAGCAPKPTPVPPTETPTAPVLPTEPSPAVALAFPTGQFTNTDWSLDFKADNTYTVSGSRVSETGTYTVNGDQVVITCQCCGSVKGTYNWDFDGQTLTFQAVEDACFNRMNVVSSGIWSLNP